MRTTPRLFAAALVLAAAAASARADVVEATATTVVLAGQQLRGAPTGQTPGLDTVVPAFELVTITARELRNPLLENLEVVVSGWGSYDLGEVRWNSGSSDDLTGDLTTGYVRGQLFHRALTLRLGRASVATGSGRMLQLDGGDLLLRVPGGVSLSAFAGSPVAQRFRTRAGARSWNPAGGDIAYGGRLGWSLPVAGAAGRGVDVGVSAVMVEDGALTVRDLANPGNTRSDTGGTVRKDVGFDLRVQPVGAVVVTANGTWALEAERLAELGVAVLWTANQKTFVTVDARRVAPDLFLSQNSILSVFSDTERTDLGGGVRYQLSEALGVGVDYHALLEPTGEGSKTELGHEAAARAEWEHGVTRLGGELSYLRTQGLGVEKNGWVGARVFGRRELGRAFVAGDAQVHSFQQEINGNKLALTGVLSAGYALGSGWSAVLAGRAGVNPFLEQQADLMVKLVYNQTYRVREVK